MIVRPRSSVTRFFVPLIDVLILLFCIFLLMPFVTPASGSSDADESADAAAAPTPEELPSDVEALRQELEETRAELKRLERRPADLAERLSLKILEIDLKSGKLVTALDGQREEIENEKEAEEMIDRHTRLSGGRETLFLILLPKGGAPRKRDMDNYRHWFERVPYSFDESLNTLREKP